MTTFDLFVYGTLRSGDAGAGMLDGCTHVGAGIVHGIMYDIDGRFPAIVLYGDSAPVHGEVWRCPASLLPGLDRYEGVAKGLFRRVATEVQTVVGPLPCWVYTAGPALSRKLALECRVPSGDWSSARAHESALRSS